MSWPKNGKHLRKVTFNTSKGGSILVEELSDNDFTEFFHRDEAVYDQSKYPLTRGAGWPANAAGDF